MNRAARLRAAAPGATDAQIAALSRLPAYVVNAIAAYGRQAGRDRLAADKAARAQARKDRRDHGHTGHDAIADSTNRLIAKALVPRAAADLEALTRLAEHYQDGPAMIALAVAGLRAATHPSGRPKYSDTKIGMALGYPKDQARQEIRRRFGRRPPVRAAKPPAAPAQGGTSQDARPPAGRRTSAYRQAS